MMTKNFINAFIILLLLVSGLIAGTAFPQSDVVLKPGNVWETFSEELNYPVCLDNPTDLVGGIQFDLCEYSAGLPNDCMTCTDCELTERTSMFSCAAFELSNGCCRVILFSPEGGVVAPGLCDVVTVVYEPSEECLDQTCTVQVPDNIVVSDNDGIKLPASGLRGQVCFIAVDTDSDGIPDDDDNCPITPNGPNGGTCSSGTNPWDPCTIPGVNEIECGTGGFCSMNQEDGVLFLGSTSEFAGIITSNRNVGDGLSLKNSMLSIPGMMAHANQGDGIHLDNSNLVYGYLIDEINPNGVQAIDSETNPGANQIATGRNRRALFLENNSSFKPTLTNDIPSKYGCILGWKATYTHYSYDADLGPEGESLRNSHTRVRVKNNSYLELIHPILSTHLKGSAIKATDNSTVICRGGKNFPTRIGWPYINDYYTQRADWLE